MTLEDLIQELGTKVDGINTRLDALGIPGGNPVDLTPVLAAIAVLDAKIEEVKLQVTPA